MTTIATRTRQPYDTALTTAQWQVLEPLLPPPAKTGRPRTVDLREVLNALFYLVRAGCAWRLLPKEFPGWTTVRYYFDGATRSLQKEPTLRGNGLLDASQATGG